MQTAPPPSPQIDPAALGASLAAAIGGILRAVLAAAFGGWARLAPWSWRGRLYARLLGEIAAFEASLARAFMPQPVRVARRRGVRAGGGRDSHQRVAERPAEFPLEKVADAAAGAGTPCARALHVAGWWPVAMPAGKGLGAPVLRVMAQARPPPWGSFGSLRREGTGAGCGLRRFGVYIWPDGSRLPL